MQLEALQSDTSESGTSGKNFSDVGEVQRATEELGAMAGVSHKTYEHAVAVLDKAPASVVEATRKKELSINAAYEVTKLPAEKQTEISERIEKGETPRRVVAEVKAKRCDDKTNRDAPKTEESPRAGNVPETEDVTLSIAVGVLKRVKTLAEAQSMDIQATLLDVINTGLLIKQQE